MKAILFTDIHLRPDRLQDQNLILQFVIKLAVRLDCNAVFFLGDAYHDRKAISQDCYNAFYSFVRKLNEYDIKFYAISGNHDRMFDESRSSALKSLAIGKENVIVDGKESYQKDNMLFVPYLKEKDFVVAIQETKSKDEIEYIFMHEGVDKIRMKNNWVHKSRVKESLFKGFKNLKRIFVGHFHDRLEHGLLYYIGSPLQFSQAEEYRKGVFFFDNEKHKLEFYRTKFPVFKTYKLEPTAEGIANGFEIVKEEVGNFIRLVYKGDRQKLLAVPVQKLKEKSKCRDLDVDLKPVDFVEEKSDLVLDSDDIMGSFGEYAKQEGMTKKERKFGMAILRKAGAK